MRKRPDIKQLLRDYDKTNPATIKAVPIPEPEPEFEYQERGFIIITPTQAIEEPAQEKITIPKPEPVKHKNTGLIIGATRYSPVMISHSRKGSSIIVHIDDNVDLKIITRIQDENPWTIFRYSTKVHKHYLKVWRSAVNRKKSFTISFSQFKELIICRCRYCGGKSSGLDRINSSIGYEIDNVTACCNRCNMMKYTYSEKDFIDHIRKILQHLKG